MSGEQEEIESPHNKPFLFDGGERKLAAHLRQVARGKSVLFHGTSLGSLIVRTDTLLVPSSGDPSISFTRSPEWAAHFAGLPKTDDDGLATVFVFEREALRYNYRLELHQDSIEEGAHNKFEMEERVYERDIRPVSKLLHAITFSVHSRVITLTSRRTSGPSTCPLQGPSRR
ncbi:hypothetical protein ABMA46_21285 [Mesorhizobium sp. CN5-321]|jgi:hypothetical protein|uniref:hypothetical protein n=1 Tax=Mesorhizobium hunchu TaxID=3157708 RepID=UPI0032B7F4FB